MSKGVEEATIGVRTAAMGPHQLGELGEHLARQYLEESWGMECLAHRARTPVGEIDLVMRRGCEVHFIEVKSRRDWGGALSINTAKFQRMRRAAGQWMMAHGYGPANLGVVEIALPARSATAQLRYYPEVDCGVR